MPKTPIAYIEFPSQDVAASKHFYASLFGWTFHDFGPNYTAFSNAGVEGGFNGEEGERTKAPLVVPRNRRPRSHVRTRHGRGRYHHRSHLSLPWGTAVSLPRSLRNEVAVMQPA